MSSALLHLTVPVDQAREAVGAALAEHGYVVQPTAFGSLDVSRDDRGGDGTGTGEDPGVRFDVHFPAAEGETVAAFERSAVAGLVGDAAAGADDVIGEAARVVRLHLAQQGLLSAADAEAVGGTGAADGTVPAPVPPAPAPEGYPGAATPGFEGYPGAASPGDPAFGGYPAAPGYAAATAPAEGRTNTVSIVAIVLGFVVPIGGIIAGAIGLSQIKRTGEKGRGLALTGIIAGSVLTVLGVLGSIAFLALFLFAQQQIAAGAAGDPFASPSTAPDGGADPNQPPPGTFATLSVGQCLDDVPQGYVTSENVVDCDAPHFYEVFSSFTLTDGVFPGDDAVESRTLDTCDNAFAQFVGVDYQASELEYTYLAPIEETWAQGDRAVSCLLYDPAGEITGSLQGSAR